MDYTNLRWYLHEDRISRQFKGHNMASYCEAMKRGDDGLPGCTAYEKRGKGCRDFPWHPRQLDNTKDPSLPRVPIFNIGYNPIVTNETKKDEQGRAMVFQKLEDPKLNLDDLKIVGWDSFSTVCGYRFIDVTYTIERPIPKSVHVEPERNPTIHLKLDVKLLDK